MYIECEQEQKKQFSKLSTPCFIIQNQKFDELINSLVKATSDSFSNTIIGYSFKTNNLPRVIQHAKERGLYAEVVSSDEYNLAKALGYTPSQIIFNGPVKGKVEFFEAVTNGAIVNVDSHRELEWLKEMKVASLQNSKLGLRVNFCVESKCPGESQSGIEDGRFGFSLENEELSKAITFFKSNNIPLSGLHLHVSSKTRSLNIYKAIAEIAVEVVEKYRLDIKYIDVGGGFFGGVPGKPSFDDYFTMISKIFNGSDMLKQIQLVVEPGMSLIGASIDYLTRVVDIKQTQNNKFALLDGSRIHIDPLMKKTSYTFQAYSDENENCMSDLILCGFTCMENDRFFKYSGKKINEDDYILFQKVGAYTIGLAPQFIEAHPAVYEHDNKGYRLVRAKKSLPID